ncbi:MAG: oligopeptide transporter, OPT family [Candidatus Neomarinimicrobiota bacterium]|nr:MAG: oligopeptide transporter, OPT family [Candidatus Neomarinimicrobiota bacterium]
MKQKKHGLPPEAYEKIPADKYQPYIPKTESMTELTVKSLIYGSIFGILFGMANAYLGLMAGLTISTAIPLAVITVAVARIFQRWTGKTSILENNITKTAGSASSSLASGIIFTIPALFLWGYKPGLLKITLIALAGGLLGVLFMIPLRRFLIRNEHGNLPYPEGIGSAEVLVAADTGGTQAKNVFYGLGIGFLYTFLMDIIKLFPRDVWVKIPFIKKAHLGMNTRPALLGVGYILGLRIAIIMVSGGLLSWLIIIPLIGYIGGDTLTQSMIQLVQEKGDPVTDLNIAKMIWEKYIRYIGAGAVATAGFITLIKSIPTMIASFKIGIQQIRGRLANNVEIDRTDHDLSIKIVFGGIFIIAIVLAIIPTIFDFSPSFWFRLLAALCVALFAFFFTTVSARIVGLVGVTSNPTSGMIIATLICTSLIFLGLGITNEAGKVAALTVGAVVGCAASIAGDTSQDLKAGFLLGATPSKQQIAELIGVLTTCFFVAGSVLILGKAYTFGSPELPAPQASMMMMVIDGIFDKNIPWLLVFSGVGITLIVHFLFKLPSLAFAVGVYLPVSTMVPIFFGGLIRKVVEKRCKGNKNLINKRREGGILFGSGLVGGDGLMGVLVGLLVIIQARPKILSSDWAGPFSILVGLAFFCGLAYLLIRSTKVAKSGTNDL